MQNIKACFEGKKDKNQTAPKNVCANCWENKNRITSFINLKKRNKVI